MELGLCLMFNDLEILSWNRIDCPFRGTDGKVWEWNQKGGQSYVKCDHQYDKNTITSEMKQLIKDIAKLKSRHQELSEMIKSSIKD